MKQTFYLGYALEFDTVVAFQSQELAAEHAEEWVTVEAMTLDEAFSKYENAFDTWLRSFNDTEEGN